MILSLCIFVCYSRKKFAALWEPQQNTSFLRPQNTVQQFPTERTVQQKKLNEDLDVQQSMYSVGSEESERYDDKSSSPQQNYIPPQVYSIYSDLS